MDPIKKRPAPGEQGGPTRQNGLKGPRAWPERSRSVPLDCLLSNAQNGLPVMVGTTFQRLTEIEIGLEKRVFKY